MKAAVIVFPGSNCDRDVAVAVEAVMGVKPAMVWHRDGDLPAVDLIVLPGGFSHGDYLRSGAMAARAPVMRAVAERAAVAEEARAAAEQGTDTTALQIDSLDIRRDRFHRQPQVDRRAGQK